MAREAVNELSPCPVMAEAACDLSPCSGPADGAILELIADFELSVLPVTVDLFDHELSVCPISPKESNVEPAPNNVCPAPNKKPVICPISLVVSPKTVNSLHIYPVNPVTDNITTLNRINTALSALTVTAQKPAFAHFTPPVLSPETIYANFITNPVCGLPPDSHQRSPFHRIDSCTTLLLHVTHGLQFPSSIALTTHTVDCTNHMLTPENYHTITHPT